jgi:hypothetical protein
MTIAAMEPTRDYVEWGPDLDRRADRPNGHRAPSLDEPATRARVGELIARMIIRSRSHPRATKLPRTQ